MDDSAATAKAEQVPFLQEKRILATAGIVLALDQLTKWITVASLKVGEKVVVINGFFDFVHWRNPGAAWSILEGKSFLLAIVSIFALGALIHFREHFEIGTRTGKLAMGAMIGGIIGNCIDRLQWTQWSGKKLLVFPSSLSRLDRTISIITSPGRSGRNPSG